MSLLGDLGTAIKNKLGGASVDNTVPRYDGTTCKLQGSGVTISDTNVVTASGGFVGNLTGNATNATNATNLNNVVEATTATANTIVKRDANGYVYVAALNSTLADTATAATHYYCETGSDGWLRPKTLSDVKAEIAGDKAPLASPALTGTPTAPTAAVGTNTTQIATTAFVKSVVASAGNVGGAATFTASGTWTCPAGVYTAFVRVIGGGAGGGGADYGVGGGGGSAVENTSIVKVTPGTVYTITIGAGGAGGVGIAYSTGYGGSGGNSSALGITGYGGSGGAGKEQSAGGGSGSGFPFSPFAAGSSGSGDGSGGCAIWMNTLSARAGANTAGTLPGQGGGGGTGAATAGKAGFRGQVYICW